MLHKIQALFENITDKVENNPTPVVRYFYLYFAILALRLTLEFFSSHRLFTFPDILHIGLWFTFIVLAFLLQLHLFSGEPILKITKLVITFFTLALTAPIIDLLITGGVGAKMNYLSLNSWQDVWWSYLTVGGSSLSRGATPGIRVEIVLLVIACFNYVWTKKNSVFWGLLSAWCIYTVLFISGAVPAILGYIVNTFHLQYQQDDQSTLLLLLTLDLFLLFLCFLRYSPSKIYALLKATPWSSRAFAWIYFSIGMYHAFILYPDNWMLTPTTLFWFPLLGGLLLCFAALTGMHRINDRRQDTPITDNRVGNGLLRLILLISAMISAKTFFLAALIWGLLFMLKEYPLKLDKVPFLRNLLTGMVFTAETLAGFCTFGGPMVGFPVGWLFGLLFCGIAVSFFLEKIGKRRLN